MSLLWEDYIVADIFWFDSLQLAEMKKKVFDTCLCYEIYRVKAADLKLEIIPRKLWFLWKCEIWDNFLKNFYVVNNCLIKIESKKAFCTCDTYNFDYLQHTIFCFYLINFQVNTHSQFCIFSAKSPIISKISVSPENALKRAKIHPRGSFWGLFLQNYGLKWLFMLIENNLWILR